MKNFILPAILALVWCACQSDNQASESDIHDNPPADGFNLAESDPAAIELADSIMMAVGGRKNW
ncbi:MAG: hypothetical protein RIA63_03520, partial [Cyclobacteriaceae bacterium]